MRLLTFGFAVVFVACCLRTCDAQTFQFSPYWIQPSQVVVSNGPGYPVTYYGGNASLSTRGAVVLSGSRAVAPTVLEFSGATRSLVSANTQSRNAGSTSSGRGMKRSETRDPLEIAEEKARDLLLRTAGLREAKFPSSNDDANAKKSADAKTNEIIVGGVVAPTRDFGTDPWKDVKDNPKLDTAIVEDLPAPVGKP